MRIKTKNIKMNFCRTSVILMTAIIILAAVNPVSALDGIENLKITISSDYKLTPGESFQLNFIIYKPLSLQSLNGVFFIESVHAKPYSEVTGGIDNYVENKTEYILNGILNADAPVDPAHGVDLLVHWIINLDNNYFPTSLEPGDNLTITINSIEYTARVFDKYEIDGNTHYYLSEHIRENKGVFVSENTPNQLHVIDLYSYAPPWVDYFTDHGGGFWWFVLSMIIFVSAIIILMKYNKKLKHIL